jgi:hypothetical protein
MSFSAHVNFQTATAATPSGYVADTGKTYGTRNGLTYGWDKDISADARNKDSSLSRDQRYDTFNHMQRSGNRTWNIAVPDGTYNVHIVSGDAGYYDSAFRVAAEGKTVVNGNPTSSNRWVEGTQSITVTDGKLTISNASGASNNKIDFIDITQTSSSTSNPQAPDGATVTDPSKPYAPLSPSNLSVSSASSTSLNLKWSDNTNRELGYKIERSTDGSNFSQVATLSGSATSYTNTGLSSGKKYYYRVRAYNEYGNSSYTNTASATTGSSSSSGGTSSGSTLTIPPAAPTSLSLSSPSSTSIKLTWRDNSVREDGYKIYRSTDGSSFSQVATVGASVTSYTNSGLSSSKKYYYKVTAYNEYGNSSYTNTASLTTGSSGTSGGGTSTPSGTPTTGFFDGVFVGGEDPNKIIPILRDLGAKGVRLWGSISDWGSRTVTSTMKNAIAYHNAGFKVNLLLQNSKVIPSYSQAKAYYAWALTVPNLKNAVDYWEIQNEPNLRQYWTGTLKQYVDNVLKAAWDTIHAAGEKVVGAGLTASRSSNQQLKDAGYLNYVDYANVHPYDSGASGQRQTITDIKAMFSGKPLVITEWGLQTSGTDSWAAKLDENHPFVAANTSAAYYFPLIQTNTPAGGEALLNTSLGKRQPFYDMYKSWHS